MNNFINEMKEYNELIRLNMPKDIDNLMNRNRDVEKNYGVMVLAYCDFEAADAAIFQLIEIAQDQHADLTTLKMVASHIIDWNIGGFKSSYNLYEGARLLIKGKEYLSNCSTMKEFVDLLEVMHRYFITITYWIDLKLPWAELSKTYHVNSK
ncbi:MAG: hypothetical protein RSC93_09490 [Erysipelotrichaceae bacterium]